VVLKEKFGTNPKLIKYKHIKPDSLILGTLAAIDVKYKGHDLVLNAIKKLKEKSLNIKYYIAGKGNPQRLIDLAKNLGVTDNIVFLGLLDHSQINSFFEKIDIYVQPSRQEGLPRAVVEAMNFGCACIGSSAGGIPELLHKDVIFKSDSVSSLINKITLFNNPEIFMEQSQINFENAGKYKFIHLEEKRKEFYDDFLKSIK
jgi:glycosyltransferase involved in cell wall biosynthesis